MVRLVIFKVQPDGVFKYLRSLRRSWRLRIAPLQNRTGDKKSVCVAFNDYGKRVVLYGSYCTAICLAPLEQAGEGARPHKHGLERAHVRQELAV